MLSVVFISNYYNHHQSSFSEKMYEILNGEYRFIATEPMDKERINMGWGGENASYVIQYSDNPTKYQKIIDEADVVIYGSAPYRLVNNRLKMNKLTFVYSERIYKCECPLWQIPLRVVNYFWKWGRFKNLYLLCASAYTAADYKKTGTFIGKTYKWGYFPEVKAYDDINNLIESKTSKSILWVARFIDWKHPEIPILVAKKLKDEGYRFQLNLIGNGEMEPQMCRMIEDKKLMDCVNILGPMKPVEVRSHMEKSQIFMFTSDRNEGWGAVLNEAMNSGCACVASHAIGSVPYNFYWQ